MMSSSMSAVPISTAPMNNSVTRRYPRSGVISTIPYGAAVGSRLPAAGAGRGSRTASAAVRNRTGAHPPGRRTRWCATACTTGRREHRLPDRRAAPAGHVDVRGPAAAVGNAEHLVRGEEPERGDRYSHPEDDADQRVVRVIDSLLQPSPPPRWPGGWPHTPFNKQGHPAHPACQPETIRAAGCRLSAATPTVSSRSDDHDSHPDSPRLAS